MNLDNVKIEALLPGFMRDGPDIVALASAVNKSMRRIYATAQLLTTWDKIDELPEDVLDRLAEDLDIDWYDYGASIETKRLLVKQSDIVHAKKGTVAAVESVIRAYFGDEKLLEWYEYGGEPHHFKVFTTEPSMVAENYEKFLSMLERVKRKSSKLDSILIGLTGLEWVYTGAAHRCFTHENHHTQGYYYVLADWVSHQKDTINVSIGTENIVHSDMMLFQLAAACATERTSMAVTISTDHPIEGDVVSYQMVGAAISLRDSVRIRIGG